MLHDGPPFLYKVKEKRFIETREQELLGYTTVKKIINKIQIKLFMINQFDVLGTENN